MALDVLSAYRKSFARADNAALNICHSLGCIEAHRDDPVTWDAVATMNHIAEKLKEILECVESYEAVATEDGEVTVAERRAERKRYEERMKRA